jgi:hypothetical protein
MQKRAWVFGAVLWIGLVDTGCGSGACRQTPCLPGIPLLQSTCKCVPTEDGGPPIDAADPTLTD